MSEVKHPCQGCVYFDACGNTNRTQPCEGCVTKSQRKAELVDTAPEKVCMKYCGNEGSEVCKTCAYGRSE